MLLSQNDKELLLTILGSYTAYLQWQTWNDSNAKKERIEKATDLANRIYYSLVEDIK